MSKIDERAGQASPEVVKAKERTEKIAEELRVKKPDLKELLDEYEEAQTLLKVEEAFDIFQEGFKLGFCFRNNID